MKKICKISIIITILLLIVFRWCLLNQGNHGRYKIIAPNQRIVVDELEYLVDKSCIYEMPAIVEDMPKLEKYYTYATNHYVNMGMEEAFASLKYVVYVEFDVKNVSYEDKEIVFTDYYLTCKNQSVLQGGFPEMIKEMNSGIIDKTLKPNEKIKIKMCYNIIGENISNLSFDKLRELELMIPISGGTDPKALSISNSNCIKSKGKFNPYQNSEDIPSENERDIPSDTKTGSVLPVGSVLIEGGVGYTVKDVVIVENLKDFKDYNEDSWLGYYEESFLEKDGLFRTVGERNHGLPNSYYKKGYKNYAIFITLSMENYTNNDKSNYIGFDLYNSKKTLVGPREAEYIDTPFQNEEKNAYKGFLAARDKIEITLGYTRSIRNDKDIFTMPLYIANDYDDNFSDFDLNHGKGGFGRYLRIQ